MVDDMLEIIKQEKSGDSLYKGQIKLELFLQANVSSKKQTNEFPLYKYDIGQFIFVRFLEEIEDTKKTFRNLLTFTYRHLLDIILRLYFVNVTDNYFRFRKEYFPNLLEITLLCQIFVF